MWIKSAGCGAAHELADLYPCLIIWPNISSYNQAPGPSPPVQMNEWRVGALDNVWAQHACTRTTRSLHCKHVYSHIQATCKHVYMHIHLTPEHTYRNTSLPYRHTHTHRSHAHIDHAHTCKHAQTYLVSHMHKSLQAAVWGLAS